MKEKPTNRIPRRGFGWNWLRSMKLMLVILIVIVFKANAVNSLQQVKVTLDCRNMALQKVFKDLEKQTNLYFFFNDKSVDVEKKITLSVKDQELDEVLKKVVGDDYKYELVNNLIVVTKIPSSSSAVTSQQGKVKISGLIVDTKGNVLPGVTVLIKGTQVGTASNADGTFTLEVPEAGQYVLQLSFVGLKTLEMKATIDSPMRIVMEPDEQMIDEVVVTGMVKMDKRLFTGATDQLKAENVKLDGIPEISRALEGRSAGVSVQNVSGTFGTAPKIRVRGATSIYGSSKPLWVVDGIVMEDVTEVDVDALASGNAETLISSAIAGLNADDIESFQILKDGSATSIYGARAMAGVIVVTTKKGKAGASRINYTGEFTMRMRPSYNQFNIMNSQEQMGVYQELQQKGFLNFGETANASHSGVYGKMYQLIDTYDPQTGTYALANTETARNAYLRQAEMRNTDWFKELFSNAVLQNHSLSMTGGTEKTTYYASLSAMVDPGWSKQSKVERYTANLNATYDIYKFLSLNIISNASYRQQKAPGTLGQTTDVFNGEVKREFDINPYSYAINSSRTLDPNEFYMRNYADFNILNELNTNYMDLNVLDLKFQAELKWKIRSGLEVSVLGAVKYSGSSIEHHIKDESNQAMAYRAMPNAVVRDANSYLYKDPDNIYALPVSVLPEGGIYNRTDNRMRGVDFRATASWNTSIHEDHIINLFGGVETNAVDRYKTFFRGWGRQYALGDIAFYAYQVFKQGIEQNSKYFDITDTRARNAAFFVNGTYSWQGKYTLNGTVRYEGSNKLGEARSARWLPTWNISGAWNAHEEEFLKPIEPALSHLTLRASYSLTADRGPASVSNALPIILSKTPWRPYGSVQETALYVSRLGNSELTYEKKHELNLGADFGFLDNKLNVVIDWYKRNNYDLIGPVTTMGIGGEVDKYGNVAEMKSNGFEFTLSSDNIRTADFNWNTSFIFSYTKTEVTKLENIQRVIDLVSGTGFTLEGYPVRSLFSVPFRGLNKDGIPTFLDQNGNITSTGIDFQERENLDFLKYEGSVDPKFTGSLGNNFTYGNWRLNIFMTYSFGNKVRLDPVFHSKYNDLDALPREFKNRWTVSGDERFTNVPVIATMRQTEDIDNLSFAYNAYNYSDVRIADGGFIRMKEISLAYDFPKRWINKIGFSNLSLKLQGTNLFLIYADKKLNGQDPEFFNTGGVAIPMARQFTCTLRVGL